MMYGRLHRAENKVCLITKVAVADNFLARLTGLLGRPELMQLEGLLIRPCSSVHTLGMRYNIDLAFLDRNWKIIKIVNALRPWRTSACPSAYMVLELLGGTLEKLQLTTGTQLEWHESGEQTS